MLNLISRVELRDMKADVDGKMNRELRMLARFIQIYCNDVHADEKRQPRGAPHT